jgi:Tol biopolymer transport system component
MNSAAKPCVAAFLVILGLFGSRPVETAQKWSDWSAPVNMGAAVNSPFEEVLPHISRDGLSLYFASDRPGFGDFDLWVSQRATRDGAWGAPVNLGPTLNTSYNDRSPNLSRDGHFLFFATNRPGGFGLIDIWVSRRTNTRDDFGWQAPVNLGPGVNGAANDFGAGFLENDDIGVPILFFGSSRPGLGGFDIYMATLSAAGSFGSAYLVTELSSPHHDFRPTIRPDGLELLFDSSRPGPPGVVGIGLRDLWTSTRETVTEPWSPPAHLGPVVNSEFDDGFPALSPDGLTLIFGSDRPGGLGGGDLHVSSRVRNR